MVRAKELTSDAITNAMTRKATSTHPPASCSRKSIRGPKRIEVEVDEEPPPTKELASAILYGRKVKEGKPGYLVEFIGPKGKVIEV